MTSVPSYGLKELESRSRGRRPSKGTAVYPFMSWRELAPRIEWSQGQHVLCVGGTGSGKSTLMGVMLRRRRLVVVTVSKGYDETLDGPLFKGYEVYRTWPPKKRHEKVLLWPPNGSDAKETRQIKHDTFSECMNDILLHVGYWCIAMDEVHYMSDSLRLETEVTDLEEQGRSFHISLWANTQRPASIPLACYVNAAHGFFFLSQEDYDLKRLGQIRNKFTDPAQLKWNLEQLDPHEFVYIDRSGKVPPVRSIVELGR